MQSGIQTIAPEWQAARRLLCVRLDTLGDVLMTTPAIRALKESIPGSRITLMTSPAGAKPAAFIPEIDEVLVYEAPWLKASPIRPDGQFDRAVIETISGRFDAAVIFTVYSQNPLPAALFCYLADIPLRLAHCRENPYHLLTHWVKEPEPEELIRHEVRRQLELVAAVGCTARDERMHFHVPPAARAGLAEKLIAAGVNLSASRMVIHPGVTAPSRQYDPDKYAQVARRLIQEDGLQVIFTGSVGEIDLVERIRGQVGAGAFSLAGQLNLGEFGALLEQTPLLLSNNTGPVHLAAAVGTPVVVLYALTNPQHTPWGVPNQVLFHDVPCKYCYKSICPMGHHHCLELVTPEQIVQAVRTLLAESIPNA